MDNTTNKIKYGLKNVYYAIVLGFLANGFPIYSPPKRLPGGVNLSLSAQGDISKFYADNIIYYQTAANNGYDGDLEIAQIPDYFRVDVLLEELSAQGVLYENADKEYPAIALLFQVEGDKKATRFAYYNGTVTRPSAEHATKEESKEPQTDTLSISFAPLENGYVRAKTTAETDSAVYNSWFSSVHLPESGTTRLSALTLDTVPLAPPFNPDIHEYTATTAYAANNIVAIPEDNSALVSITANGEAIQNGAAAPWNEGENNVLITVTSTAGNSEVLQSEYSITVNSQPSAQQQKAATTKKVST